MCCTLYMGACAYWPRKYDPPHETQFHQTCHRWLVYIKCLYISIIHAIRRRAHISGIRENINQMFAKTCPQLLPSANTSAIDICVCDLCFALAFLFNYKL